MLKSFFEQYDQVAVLHSQKDTNGKSILIQETVCNRYERIFNGEFIEMTTGNDLFSSSTVIIKNNPHEIHRAFINDHEETIILSYDDNMEIRMIGHK